MLIFTVTKILGLVGEYSIAVLLFIQTLKFEGKN